MRSQHSVEFVSPYILGFFLLVGTIFLVSLAVGAITPPNDGRDERLATFMRLAGIPEDSISVYLSLPREPIVVSNGDSMVVIAPGVRWLYVKPGFAAVMNGPTGEVLYNYNRPARGKP